MSVRVLSAVFELSEARGNDRLVLLALADYANDESWSCYPSVASIATKARVSPRTVQRSIKSLREAGHVAVLERIASRYGTNRYVVLRPWEQCQVDTPDANPDTRQSVTPVNLTGVRNDAEGCQIVQPGVTPVSPEPSIEQPSVEPSTRRSPNEDVRIEVEPLCSLLADLIEENGSKRPTVTAAWRTACDRMLRIDGRTPEQVERAIRWAQADDFWRANILSMPTLRQKFDQLRLQARRKSGTRQNSNSTLGVLAQVAQREGLA